MKKINKIENVWADGSVCARNKGITLIALVITIVVLLILAIVSIRLVLNDGIINKAETATSAYKIEEEKEQISLGYANYKMGAASGNSNLEVKGATVESVGSLGWNVTFSETGNGYGVRPNGEIVEGKISFELVEGSLAKAYVDGELKLGDTVNYTPAKGKSASSTGTESGMEKSQAGYGTQSISTDSYTTQNGGTSVTWQVIGVNEQTGVVNLIASEPIQVKRESNSTEQRYYIYGKTGYNNGPSQLDKLCEIFGYGEGATGARSVTSEDIDGALGYDKTQFTLNGEVDDGITANWKYGWETTYKGSTTTWNPADTFVFEDGTTEYTRTGDYATFTDINGIVATDENPITITSNAYMYTRDQFTSTKDSQLLNMIFGSNTEYRFWLASRCVGGNCNDADWGLMNVDEGALSYDYLYDSDSGENNEGRYVRPVVSLESNILGEKDENGVWQMK